MANLKKHILSETNGGLDFFIHVLGELEFETDNRCKNVLNPFYSDSKPSLSIYKPNNSDRWLFKDFGDDSYKGDVFDFAAHEYNLNSQEDFYEILNKIKMDLKIDELQDDQALEYFETLKNENWAKTYSYNLTYFGYDNGIAKALTYFGRFGITERTLRKYRVSAISRYKHLISEKRIVKKYFAKDNELVIAYEGDYFAKIYRPEPKAFWYVGKKKNDYVFGLQQIYNLSARTQAQIELLIITGGEKDVLTLDSLGYNAISLNSETANLPKEFIENNTLALAKRIVILYDIDETGKKTAANLQNKIYELGYECSVVSLPDDLIEQGGKDVSDYVFLGLDISVLDELIKFSQNNSSNISYSQSITQEKRVDTFSVEEDIDSTNHIIEILKPSTNAGNIINENILGVITPYFPFNVYSNISLIFKVVLDEIDNRRDKDVFILSFLTMLSASLKDSFGWLSNNKVYPSLFTGVFASSLNAKYMMNKVVDLFKATQRINIISANMSFASLTKQLAKTGGTGIIYDPEIESIGEIKRNDKCGLAYVLKNGYDHINVVNNRSSKQNATAINEPRFSFMTGGHSKQVNYISDDVEDSLLSRFSFYNYSNSVNITSKTSDLWRYQSKAKNDYIVLLDNFLNYVNACPFELILTKSQESQIDDLVGSLKESFSGMSGININMLIENTSKIIFKLVIVLTACRKFENEDNANILECNEADFQIALSIASTLFQHSVIAILSLKEEKVNKALLPKDNKKEQLLNALPECFSRKEALFIADELKLNKTERTIDNYLKEFVMSSVLLHTHDKYCKQAA